ncbi:HK97 gp10 family phage protein [Massilia sp. CFBP 13647]|nr:HK97 gp10 family phage protein [Massilia sp. CFBP 13647]MBD8673631.1 HK97 gp10 family phage protein [Massilia sp. CFBP 13721]
MAEATEVGARPAAQAAAQVLYDEVRRNVAANGMKTAKLYYSIYQVYSQSRSKPGLATYQISWNRKKAPHGHLVEYGHIQRYVTYVGRDGNYYTAVRPEMRGKPKPKGRASQAAKDAYYIPLATPKQVAAKSFVRKAVSKAEAAADAAQTVLLRFINNDT